MTDYFPIAFGAGVAAVTCAFVMLFWETGRYASYKIQEEQSMTWDVKAIAFLLVTVAIILFAGFAIFSPVLGITLSSQVILVVLGLFGALCGVLGIVGGSIGTMAIQSRQQEQMLTLMGLKAQGK